MKNNILNQFILFFFLFISLSCAKDEVSHKKQRNYYDIIQYSPELFPIKINDKYGYINKTGEVVIDPIFYLANRFYFDRAIVIEQDTINGSKYGFINSQGVKVIPTEFTQAENFTSDGLAPVKDENGKWGYIDRSGQIKIGFQFERASPFSEGLGCVKINGKFGYIDVKGNLKIPAEFKFAGFFSEGMAWVTNDSGKYGYIDKSGNIKVNFIYSLAQFFNEGTAAVEIDGKYGFIRPDGTFAIPPTFDYAYPFFEGLAVISKDGHNACINYQGEIVFSSEYSLSGGFSEGYITFLNDESKVSYLNNSGIVNHLGTFIWADDFVNGVAEVEYWDGGYGYINKDGKEIWDSKNPYYGYIH